MQLSLETDFFNPLRLQFWQLGAWPESESVESLSSLVSWAFSWCSQLILQYPVPSVPLFLFLDWIKALFGLGGSWRCWRNLLLQEAPSWAKISESLKLTICRWTTMNLRTSRIWRGSLSMPFQYWWWIMVNQCPHVCPHTCSHVLNGLWSYHWDVVGDAHAVNTQRLSKTGCCCGVLQSVRVGSGRTIQ